MRVAYSLEQCWHRVPGGTAVYGIELAKAIGELNSRDASGHHEVQLLQCARSLKQKHLVPQLDTALPRTNQPWRAHQQSYQEHLLRLKLQIRR